jgi:hypothetical protein
VFDLWADHWRRHHADGDVIIVRFADDFIVGFQYEEDARRFLDELRERFARFGLELHPDKTRLIEFGRRAAIDRRRRGLGKPETFDFLGFTHICARARSGRFWVRRITIAKRMRAKLAEVKTRSRPSSGIACMIPSRCRDGGWPGCCKGTSPTTPYRAIPTRYRPSGTRSACTGGVRYGGAASAVGSPGRGWADTQLGGSRKSV